MPETGIVKNVEIRKNKDGQNLVVLLQVVISDPDDVQTVEWISLPGRDSGIRVDDEVLIVAVGSTKYAIAVDDGVAPEAQSGEEIIYSRDLEGAKAAQIILRVNGDIEINGDADFAVRFSPLQTQFNELNDAFNSHTHLYAPGTGTLTETVAADPQSAADISGAKIDTIKVP